MSLKVVGLDIAKHVFQVHGADARGKAVLKKRLRREQLTDFFGSIPRRTLCYGGDTGRTLLGQDDCDIWPQG